jgi:tryptophan-rich sensory protein
MLIIAVNLLCNILPLNNKTTGELSDKFESLITPAGFAFSIWSIIYLLLLIFVIKVWKEYKTNEHYSKFLLPLFIIQSLMNILWLFAWHYEHIALSALIMFGLLLALILIYKTLESSNLWILPWSVYLGWISVASIVNVSVLLLDNKVMFFLSHALFFSYIMAIAAAVLAVFFLFYKKDFFYPLVIVWALFFIGIANKGLSNYSVSLWIVSGFIVLLVAYQKGKYLKLY